MAADVGGLLIDIGMNVAGLREDMKKSNRELSRGTNRMNRHLGKLRKQVGSVTAGFKGLVGVVGFGLLARKIRGVVSEVNNLGKAAQTAGVTAETLQEVRFALGRLSNVTEKQADKSLQRFNRRLGLAIEGGGAAKDTFGELGVAMRTASGDVRQSDAVLEDVIRSLAGIEDSNVRAAKASEIFGEEAGPKLAAALDQGIEAFDKARQRARDMGLVLSNETVAGAEEAEDRISELTQALGVKFQDLVLSNTEGIIGLANAFGTLVDKIFEGIEQLREFAGVMGELAAGGLGFGPMADRIEKQINDIDNQIEALEKKRDRRLIGDPVQAAIAKDVPRDELEAELQRLRQERRRLAQEQIDAFALDTPRARRARGGGGAEVPDVSLDGRPGRGTSELFDMSGFRTMTPMRSSQKAQRDMAESFEMLKELSKDTTEEVGADFARLGESIGRAMEDSLADSFLGIETDFGDLLRRMAAQAAASQIFKQLGSIGGGKEGSAGAFFSNFFGFRAHGGDVEPGKSYVIGEKGPELVSFGRRGHVTPNDKIGGATIHQTINTPMVFPPQLEAFVRNVAGPAGRDAAMEVLRAERGML